MTVPRGLPVEARDLARLDPDAIEKVREQIRPQPRDADELHDLLMTLYVMRPQPEWARGSPSSRRPGGRPALPLPGLWCATERVPLLADLYPAARTFAMARAAAGQAAWTPKPWRRRCCAGTWTCRDRLRRRSWPGRRRWAWRM